jgi:predicted small secreted protein
MCQIIRNKIFNQMAIKLYLFTALISLVNVAVACNTQGCGKDVTKHVGDYVECDMCVCDQACNLNRDDEIYQCYVKVK